MAAAVDALCGLGAGVAAWDGTGAEDTAIILSQQTICGGGAGWIDTSVSACLCLGGVCCIGRQHRFTSRLCVQVGASDGSACRGVLIDRDGRGLGAGW